MPVRHAAEFKRSVRIQGGDLPVPRAIGGKRNVRAGRDRLAIALYDFTPKQEGRFKLDIAEIHAVAVIFGLTGSESAPMPRSSLPQMTAPATGLPRASTTRPRTIWGWVLKSHAGPAGPLRPTARRWLDLFEITSPGW